MFTLRGMLRGQDCLAEASFLAYQIESAGRPEVTEEMIANAQIDGEAHYQACSLICGSKSEYASF